MVQMKQMKPQVFRLSTDSENQTLAFHLKCFKELKVTTYIRKNYEYEKVSLIFDGVDDSVPGRAFLIRQSKHRTSCGWSMYR